MHAIADFICKPVPFTLKPLPRGQTMCDSTCHWPTFLDGPERPSIWASVCEHEESEIEIIRRFLRNER